MGWLTGFYLVLRPSSFKQTDSLASRPGRQGHPEKTHTIMAPRTSQTPAKKPESQSIPPASAEPESPKPSANGTPSDLEMANMVDEERIGLEIASAALGQPDKVGDVPFYAGKLGQPCTQR